MAEALQRVALIMIVKGSKDEAAHLQRCLENIQGHVDGIFINVNAPKGQKPSKLVLDVAKSFTNDVYETEWNDNFAEARNFILEKVTDDYTWCIWEDSDDTIDKPEKIKKIADLATNDSIFVDYVYDKDEAGNISTIHLVARMFKNNGSHAWKGRIHETLIENRAVSQGATKDFQVIHHADKARADKSHERNIKMLEQQLQDESKDPDPRTFYYLARAYYDSGYYENALPLYEDYLSLSGWDQERASAWTKLGLIYLDKGDRTKGKECFMNSIGEDPDDPTPRIELASLEIELQQFHKARKWLESVESMDKNLTTLERNPLDYTFRTYLLLAETYKGLGGSYLEKALEYAKKALKYKKTDKHIKQYVNILQSVVDDKLLIEKSLAIVKALRKNKENDKVKTLMESLPKQLEDNPIIVRLRDEESFKWPEKSIVIMTGDTALDAWGPWSLEEGIGGSEEAVIRISVHLQNLGYHVVVYGKPGHRAGLYDGVMWRNYWEANLDDKFDIFIAWRAPFIFDKKINARKNYLWLHDVVEPGEFTAHRLANLTKVIVLSKYHRSLFPMIPEDKILMSANGIDPAEFEAAENYLKGLAHVGPNRNPHKVFYGSSHVRGLAYLYEIWPEVIKAVPDATLDVYYGRESYDAVHKGNPERMKWMDNMIAKAKKLEGVTEYGKVSQGEIVRAAFRSGIWAYPCPFPEIYCITAIKCQAAGAVPVASNYAALDETIQFGHKQPLGEFDTKDLKKYKESLIWWLQHSEEQEKIRPEMMKWARTISWENVAKGWDVSFNES
jgi:tetratricopeptide (TPR) repeat protein